MKTILAVLILSVSLFAQVINPGGNGAGVTVATVATLPVGTLGRIAEVTDGNSGTDCTVGGGSTLVLCRYGGASWGTFTAGSAGAGGSTTQLQWNNATALGGVSQWTTNGTTTITGSATGVLDLHAGGTGGLLLPGGLATGIVKNTTSTGAVTILTAPAGTILGTTDVQVVTNKDLTDGTNTFPTLNQNTTGSSAKWTTARNLAGNSVDGSGNVAFANKVIVQGTVDAGLSAAQFLGALSTGIVRNTTTTGVLTSAELSGDATTAGSNAVTVVKVNGNSVTSGAANNQTLVCTGANTCVWKTIPDCVGSSNALNFTQATNVLSCLSISTLTNPMTTLGDVLYGGAAGATTRLAGPTATNGVAQVLTSTPSGGLATAPIWAPAGVAPNAQTGATYTVAATDRAGYISLSNASPIAVTLPQAGSTGFASNFVFIACDIGAGTATITPTSSTISYSTGSAYTSAAASLALTTGQCAWVYSDNTNYFAVLRGSGGGVTSVATSSPLSGGTITSTGTVSCPTCVTSIASLTNHGVVVGSGSQGTSVIPVSTTTTQALFATANDPAFRGIVAGDLPSTLTSGTAITNAALTTPNLGIPSAATLTNATGLPAAAVLSGALVNGMTATTQATADNSTKLATTAYVDTSLTCGPNPYISVKCPTYGAVGNGVTDDANAIQAAIDAAVALGGGTVYFPKGDYKVVATQGTSGANLVINGQGVRLLGCGSANEESQSASCAIIDQTTNSTLTAPTQGAFANVSAGSCDTAAGGLDTTGANCHTEGEGGTYRAIQQNNSGGVLADASKWLLFYTLTDPYLCPTCESKESPLSLVTMNANGGDGSLVVLSPDWEGRGRMWNLYICPTSNGTTCSATEKRYTASNACRNKLNTSGTLNHTPSVLGCWIGESMYVLADPTATGGSASPGTSSLTNNNTVIKIWKSLSQAVKTGPTIENLEIDTATNKGGIAIHNHAGQQVTILNTVVKGDVTSTAGIGFTGYMQSGHIAPGATRYANQTFISHFAVLKAWHGMEIWSPGSIQAGGLSLYTTTTAVPCTINTAPLPVDNCAVGIASLGTSNLAVFSGHIDVGPLSPNATGIYVNGNNNLGTLATGQAVFVNSFRIEGGCPTADCAGTESVGVRGANTNGINASFISTFGAGTTVASLDSASIGNYLNIDVPPTTNGVTTFSGSTINNVICDVKVGKCSASNGLFSGTLSAQRSTTDTVACPTGTANFATTYTIPANFLVANKVLRVTLGMGLVSTAGPTMGMNLLVGGTTVFSATQAIPATTSAATVDTGMTFYIQGSAAAGGSVAVNTDIVGLPTSGANFAPWAKSTTAQPVNLATNGTLVIQPQLACSANTAGNSMILRQMIVEALN